MIKTSLLTELACVNLAAKFSTFNLLSYGVVIYLTWSGILFSTKLLVSDILFSTSQKFVFKIFVVTKTFVLYQLFYLTLFIFVYWFMWIQVVASEFFFLSYLLLSLVCWILCFNNSITYYFTYFIFLSLQ